MAKYLVKEIESNEKLAILVSDYLRATHAAKAQKEFADKTKAIILETIKADPAEKCSYSVYNRTGKKKFLVTYTEQTNIISEEIAAEIATLEARIKELKTKYGVSSFKTYSMREREA